MRVLHGAAPNEPGQRTLDARLAICCVAVDARNLHAAVRPRTARPGARSGPPVCEHLREVRRRYADDYRGWPVAPRHRQHPVRGSFLDPRVGVVEGGDGYHPGIDVAVRDDRPERGAPPGRTHRVYALEGGRVWKSWLQPPPGVEGIVRVGHFGYGHILPLVSEGQQIAAGDVIGWTTAGEWHVHLTEWVFPGGDRERMVRVNPLDRKGKLAPYVDTAPPVIHDVAFYTPASPAWRKPRSVASFPVAGRRLDPARLAGVVDARAWIEDPQSFRGWFRRVPLLETAHHPARVHLRVTRLEDGKVIEERDVFTADVTLGSEARRLGVTPIPISNHYAPGTRQNLRAATALRLERSGRGAFWFRLFAGPRRQFWDTTRVRNGPYALRVRAWDTAGNRTEAIVEVVVAN